MSDLLVEINKEVKETHPHAGNLKARKLKEYEQKPASKKRTRKIKKINV